MGLVTNKEPSVRVHSRDFWNNSRQPQHGFSGVDFGIKCVLSPWFLVYWTALSSGVVFFTCLEKDHIPPHLLFSFVNKFYKNIHLTPS